MAWSPIVHVAASSSAAPVGPAAGSGVSPPATSGAATRPADGFNQLLGRLLDDANSQQLQSQQAVKDFAAGESENVHDVVLAVAKADLSFRMVLEIRNRLVDAYQEVMRMQF